MPTLLPRKINNKITDETDTPTDTQVLTFDSASDKWISADASGGGEVNTSSNAGCGDGWALAKCGVDLPFKSLITSSPIATTVNVNDLTITIDNIAFTLLADGTDGELITWNACGAPAAVATGSSGEVLTSNGVGTAPTFQSFCGALPVADTTSIVEDPVDTTKEMRIDVGAVTTGTVRVLTMPDANVDLGALTASNLAPCSVGSSEIAACAVGTSEIAANGVDTAELAASAVETAKINNCAVTVCKMAANSVDSAQYVDGSIDTIHIADDQITLAKMATGTDGNLITYDACTNPAFVATGTAAQVLTSNGAGAAPTFQAAAGGSQTPWIADIDADGFDLKDLSNIEFRTTTGAPAGTVQAVWADAGGINYNVPTSDSHDFFINGVLELQIIANSVDVQNNNIAIASNQGIIWGGSSGRNISNFACGFVYEVETNDIQRLRFAGTDEYTFRQATACFNGNDITELGSVTDASAGAIRLGNNEAINARNAANSADFGITLDASDNIAISDATCITTNATTGTSFGSATTQKISFYGVTPIVQEAHIADPSGGCVIDVEARTAIDSILADLALYGLQASS